jgi:probable rRNA maturation factor
MTIFLEIDPSFSSSTELPNFRECVFAVFNEQGVPQESDVSIIIVDDDLIHKLNLEFLGQDKPTDVLAFPAGHIDPDTGHRNIGDVIISYPRAIEQAASAQHPVVSELSLLAIHGLLHLIGFDHDVPERQAVMWQVQNRILDDLGVRFNPPTFSNQSE